jgi:type I restriction enzyme S subunit
VIQNIPLGELFKISSGGTPSRKEPSYYEGGNIAWIKTGDLHNKRIFEASEYITQEGLDNSSAKLFPAGTILVAMYGATIGACSILEIEAATNQACAAFPPNDQVDTLYLYYFLKSKKSDFVRDGVGGAQPNISGTYLKMVEIPFPPLETQKHIAAVLEKADQLRKDCQKMEQELNSLAQSVFIEMFGDPVTNPKGWKIKPLVELLNKPLQNGAYYPKEDYSEDGVEMVHMSDVFYDFVERGNMKRVKVSKKDIEKYKLTSNDILISRRSLMLEGAAKPSLVQESGEDLIFESSIIRLTPDTKQVNIMYLFYYLSHPKAKQHYVYQYITGATIKGINQANLEKVEILVPDMEVQNSFLERESIIRNQKNDLKKLIVEIDTNFNALMQKAFNGELNLDNAKTQ